MREVKYLRFLDTDNILRIQFFLEHGEVMSFMVQLECDFGDHGWIPVVRYDTAHGFAHRDKMHPHRDAEKTEISMRSYKDGLTFAIDDLESNWHVYRRRYAEWLKK